MSTNLFDGLDDGDEGDIFGDQEAPVVPNGQEPTTPDCFHKIDPSSEMNLFSPKRAKEMLFEDDDDEEEDKPPQDIANGSEDVLLDELDNEDEGDKPKEEEPLAFMKDEEEKEDFEMIDSAEAPSVEEADRQLEIMREEIARRKREEAEEQERQLEEQEMSDDGEAPDGAMFSKGSAPDPPLVNNEDPLGVFDTDEPEDSSEKTDQNPLVEQLQEQVAQLTANLRSAQAENGSLTSEVSTLRQQLQEEREKTSELEETIKKKDAEIAALKEAGTSSPTKSHTGSKPPLSPRKPSLTAKPVSVTSPRSARLKQDAEKKSVAETIKKFGQTSDKKTSPASKRKSLPRKASSEKIDKPSDSPSRIPRQDSASSRKKDSEGARSTAGTDKKQSSPPKPVRTKPKANSKSDDSSPMISTKSQRNTLDAIKLWEQKSGDKKESSPVVVKKSLTGVKSSPVVGESEKPDENGEENVPPVETDELAATDSTNDVNGDEPKAPEQSLEQQKSPLRQGNKDSAARQKKTESVIVSGSKAKRWQQSSEKCQVCKKSVYPLERLQADEKIYHKTCFRCSHCKKVIGLGTYAAIQGELYCKTHFKMLFKMKGNYDEGFGREQHKKKWSKSALQEDETAPTED